MPTLEQEETISGIKGLRICLVGSGRKAGNNVLMAALGARGVIAQEVPEYPSESSLPAEVISANVVIVDLSVDPDRALLLIERICAIQSAATVMAYSPGNTPDLLVRCMRAGARELLTGHDIRESLSDALSRACQRISASTPKKARGKLLTFLSAKGGSGVSMIASNFAVALTLVSQARVVLVDLDLQIGDAALSLGLNAQFSVVDALSNPGRLDRDFVSSLLAKHGSGLSVLAGPEEFTQASSLEHGVEKLFRVLRDDFDYVVVDGGSNLGRIQETAAELGDRIYLITQITIPALRAANRLITHFVKTNANVTIDAVINRHDSRNVGLDENLVEKALTVPVRWKVPNHFEKVRDAQNIGTPLVGSNDSPVSRALFQMAREACGKTTEAPKKKRFGLFS